MKVCVVLVNYHGAVDIAQAVMSVLIDAPDVEIVVVDNSDDAQEWRRLGSLLPPSVRRFCAPGNIGFGQACNLAVENTLAPFIFLVNPDVRLVPGCIRALHDGFSTSVSGPIVPMAAATELASHGAAFMGNRARHA